nr:IucA/IucC family protein [Micromonospora sp. DSM 115978]
MDAGLLAALLVREIATRDGVEPASAAVALGRMIDSVRRVAVHVQARRTGITGTVRTSGTTGMTEVGGAREAPFLAAEQSLVFGHPFHPASKARTEASDAELADYSPELGGQFRLHWFAAHPS